MNEIFSIALPLLALSSILTHPTTGMRVIINGNGKDRAEHVISFYIFDIL